MLTRKDLIKETIIGTIASILSNSKLYEEGTSVITLAYSDDEKIKISARNVGKQGRNVRDLLANITSKFQGEVGGHEYAAGCLIKQEHEEKFIEDLRKNLEIEVIRI